MGRINQSIAPGWEAVGRRADDHCWAVWLGSTGFAANPERQAWSVGARFCPALVQHSSSSMLGASQGQDQMMLMAHYGQHAFARLQGVSGAVRRMAVAVVAATVV